MSDSSAFEGFAILELMGHRRLAGWVSEQQVAGTPFVRIDVPTHQDGEYGATQFYAPAAVYALTPTTEEIARGVAASSQPRPVQRWELPPGTPGDHQAENQDPSFEFEDEPFEDDEDELPPPNVRP